MRKIMPLIAISLVFGLVLPLGSARSAERVYRIGLLGQGHPSSYVVRFSALRKELRSRGYEEGLNIRYEYRYAGGKVDQLPSLAAELVRLKVDVIVATSTPSTRAAMKASRAIPIVMNAGTPVESGLVQSLARPGGNVTGVTLFSGPEFYTKRLDFLKEVAPSARRIAVIWNPANSAHRVSMKNLQKAAPKMGVTLLPVITQGTVEDTGSTLERIKKVRPDALLAFGYTSSGKHRKPIAEFAARNRIPAIFPNRRWITSGGLMAYTVNQTEMARQKAVYVDKILKGKKPADLPVERPGKFDLIINLQTARMMKVALPPGILLRATKVIR